MAKQFNSTLTINVKTLNIASTVGQVQNLSQQVQRANNLKINVDINVRRYSQTISQLRNILNLLNAINRASAQNAGVRVRNSGGGGGSQRNSSLFSTGEFGIGGLIAHAVPVEFYNAIQAFRAAIALGTSGFGGKLVEFARKIPGLSSVIARASALLMRMGPVGGAIVAGLGGTAVGLGGAGLAAILIGSIQSLHSFKTGIGFATNALQTMASMVLRTAYQFAGKVFELIDEQQKSKILFMNLLAGKDKRSQEDVRVMDPALFAAREARAAGISRQLGMAGMRMGLSQGQTSALLGQLIPEMSQAMARGLKPGQNPIESPDFTQNAERMIAFSKVLSSFGERQPKYYMFALTEMLQGKTGQKGVTDLFKSLKLRASINVAEYAKPIAEMFQKGKIKEGFELVEQVFNRTGQRLSSIGDVLATTVGAKFEYLRGLIQTAAVPLFDPFHKALMGVLSVMNQGLSEIMEFDNFKQIEPVFKTYGAGLANALIDGIVGPSRGSTDMFLTGFFRKETMGDKSSPQRILIDQVFQSIKAMIPIAINAGKAILNLFKGFFIDGDAVEDFKRMSDALGLIQGPAGTLGESLRNLAVRFAEYIPQIIESTIFWTDVLARMLPYLKMTESFFTDMADKIIGTNAQFAPLIQGIENLGNALSVLIGKIPGVDLIRGVSEFAGALASGENPLSVMEQSSRERFIEQQSQNRAIADSLGILPNRRIAPPGPRGGLPIQRLGPYNSELFGQVTPRAPLLAAGNQAPSPPPRPGQRPGGFAAAAQSINNIKVEPKVMTEHKTTINAKVETNIDVAVVKFNQWLNGTALPQLAAAIKEANAGQDAKMRDLIANLDGKNFFNAGKVVQPPIPGPYNPGGK